MFDKAVSAQQAIERGTSKLYQAGSEGVLAPSAAESSTQNTADEKPISDLSVDVDDFIKQFSASSPAKHAAKSASKPQPARKQSDEDISSLMSDYVKIMNDQEEDDEAPKRFYRRKKEKKKLLSEIEEEAKQEQKSAEEETQEPSDLTLEQPQDEAPSQEPQSEPDDALPDLQEADEVEEAKQPKAKKGGARVFARVLLSIILAVCIVFSLATASLSTVLNVNTGKEALGELYFFTSSHQFSDIGIESGDLVICRKQTTVDDEMHAVYIDLESKTFSFGIKNGAKTDGEGNIIYIIGGNEIDRNSVLGTVEKTIPMLGKVIGVVYANYTLILAALVALCILLLVLIVFALKNKDKKKAAAQISSDGEAQNEEAAEAQIDEETEDEDAPDDDESGNLFSELK